MTDPKWEEGEFEGNLQDCFGSEIDAIPTGSEKASWNSLEIMTGH